MSGPKWTPGPWHATWNGTCWQLDASPDAVATTQFCYAPETEANARLIAAAPELYAALDDAEVDLDLLRQAVAASDPTRELLLRISDMRGRIAAAMAKARGEP